MFKLNIFLIFIGGYLSFCSKNSPKHPDSSLANSFGSRPKTKVADPSSYPYSSIGRVGKGCVATLVGRSIGVTAGHCAIDEGTGEVRKDFQYFVPNLENAEPIYIDKFWYGAAKPGRENRAKDWVIFHLVEPIGDRLKWMLVEGVDIAQMLPFTVHLAGYAEDFFGGQVMYEFPDCMILEASPNAKDKGNLYHNCNTGIGSSGAPLFFPRERGVYLEAIHVSEKRKNSPTSLHLPKYSFEYANIAISSKEFQTVLELLRSTVDQGKDINGPAIPDGFFAKNLPQTTSPQNQTQKTTEQNQQNLKLVEPKVFMQRIPVIDQAMQEIMTASMQLQRDFQNEIVQKLLSEIYQSAASASAALQHLQARQSFQPSGANQLIEAYRTIYDHRETLAGSISSQQLVAIEHKLIKIRSLLLEERKVVP